MNTPSSMYELCRLCAAKTVDRNRLQIFDNDGKLRDMQIKLSTCLSINVTENDFLPKFLCAECVNKLESLYEFKSICLKTDLFLKDLLSKQILPIQHSTNSYFDSEGRHQVIHYRSSSLIDRQLQLEDKDAHVAVMNLCRQQEADDDITIEPSLYNINEESSFNDDVTTKALEASALQELKDNNKPQQESTISLFRCHYCKVLFQTKKESLEHLKIMHKKIHRCDICNDSFRSLEALATHKEKFIHQLKDREDKIDGRRGRFKERIRKETKKCKMCGKEYARKYELELHERSHTGEKPFSCTYCDKTFVSTSARNKHIQVHEKRWSHICSYCSKGFVNKTQYVCHVQKHHTGERPFACSQCDKKYVRKQDLQMHELNMHSTKPRVCYKCDACNKTFTTMSYLKQHKKNHDIPLESRKKFKCNICEAVFLTKSKLKKHTISHQNVGSYW